MNMKEITEAVKGTEWEELFNRDQLAFKAGVNRAWHPKRRDMDREAAAYVKRSSPYITGDRRQKRIDSYIDGWLYALQFG